MPWLHHDQMEMIRVIRQDHAQAKHLSIEDPSPEHDAELVEQEQRRARAIRTVAEEDKATLQHLSAMFRCSKKAVRDALETEE